MAEGGYIKLYRQLRDHWIWSDAEHLKWWIDILLMANHAPKKIVIGGKLVTIGIGEVHTSVEKLSKRWLINWKTANKFLNLLKKDGMISIIKTPNIGTTLKVLHYQDYQAFSNDLMEETSAECGRNAGQKLGKNLAKNKNLKEPEEILDTPNVVSLDCWRSRYTPEAQAVIDTFFSILKHTRQSAKLSDSVIQKIYASWEPHPTEKVIYGLQKYIDNPSLHDKKENYVLGIIRNARANEVQGGQGIYTPYQAENGKTISFAEIARRMEEA